MIVFQFDDDGRLTSVSGVCRAGDLRREIEEALE